jgi:hypothetical protein
MPWPAPRNPRRAGRGDASEVERSDDALLRSRGAPSHPSFAHATKSQAKSIPKNLLPQKKKGGGASKDAGRKGPHHQAMRRAPLLPSFPCGEDRGRILKRARPHGAGALAFRRPTAALRRISSRLGSGRASWNHRMQAGGPSPAPVQRAPRSPDTRRTGRCPSRPCARCIAAPHENRPRSASRSTLAIRRPSPSGMVRM